MRREKGRGKREKQIEVVQQRRVGGEGGMSREIDNQRLTASEFEDRKEKKKRKGDLRK